MFAAMAAVNEFNRTDLKRMCGIAGILTDDGGAARSALRAMVAAMAHRGPDGSGESHAISGKHVLGLGHRRLAIIDLSANGAQPMTHPVTGDQLVYNGELYNYRKLRDELSARGCRFQGESDSEVLLHALVEWGTSALDRLEGMFAFAFHRVASRELLLGRDPLGIKPLYVARGHGTFLFASEVRTLLATGLVSDEVDLRGVAGFLSYGACQHPFTLFEAVRSFPAGCWQKIRLTGAEDIPVRYWSPPSARPGRLSASSAIDLVRETVDVAVRDHLVSDVPLGVFLSSGVDSSIVAGIAARHVPGVRSFTVGFAENPDLSELHLAGQTARRLRLDHTECHIESADAVRATTEWMNAMDVPSIDGLNVYVISKAVRERGVTVALSGQGGDELFGGYSTFADVPRLHRLMSRLAGVPRGMRQALAAVATVGRSEAVRIKASAIAACHGDLLSLYTQRRRLLSTTQLDQLGLSASGLGLSAYFLDTDETAALRTDPDDAIWSVSNLESRLYLGNMLLRDSDTNGMARGLEIRVPLLDRRLVDLAMSLPGKVRLPGGRADKHLLRTAFADLVGPDVLNQPKRGFTLPVRRWMLGPLNEICRSGLDHLKSTGLLRPEAVDEIWSRFAAEPESPAWSRAFACCVMGNYLSQHAQPAALRAAS